MKLFLFLLTFISYSSFAGDLNLKNYLKMQDSLANDDFTAALEGQKIMCAKELSRYKESYKDCGKKFKDIEELRESFKKLSSVYIANSDKKEMKDLIVAECPMAKAKWIQTKGGIRNPYFGKSMLECGQKI